MTTLPSSLHDIELLILDMDGVITSESAYWDAAGLVIRDLLDSPVYLGLCPPDYTPIADIFYQKINRSPRHDRRKYLPPELIKHCKSRGINSNWDLAYLVAGVYIAPLLSPFSKIHHALQGAFDSLPHRGKDPADMQDDILFRDQLFEQLQPIWSYLQEKASQGKWADFLRLQDFHLWGSWFRERKCLVAPVNKIELLFMDDFHPDVRGIRLLEELNKLTDTDSTVHALFGRRTLLWDECRDLFQQWYLGEELYRQTYDCPILYTPKPGLIHNEIPLHGKEKTLSALSRLRQAGYRLGIATGRPRMEILTPLQNWNALSYFEPNRIATHDEVDIAEKILHEHGIPESLGKPHPYVFMKSIHPDLDVMDIYKQCHSPLPDRRKILIVGDAMADIWAAKKIDCPCVALLSGAMGEAGYREFESAHPDLICRDFLELTDLLTAK